MHDADDDAFARDLQRRFLAGEAPSQLLEALQRRRPTNVLGLLHAFGTIFGLTLSDWRAHCDLLSTHEQTVYFADRTRFDGHMTRCSNQAKSRWAPPGRD